VGIASYLVRLPEYLEKACLIIAMIAETADDGYGSASGARR